jgi:hypothetical protein
MKKEKLSAEEEEDASIDCSTGASFAEALGMFDPMKKKKQHTALSSPGTSASAGMTHSTSKSSTEIGISRKKDKAGPSLLSGEAKFGTAGSTKPSAAQANVVRAAGTGDVSVPAPTRHIQSVTKAKPQMAPLIQKTMKLVKSFKLIIILRTVMHCAEIG